MMRDESVAGLSTRLLREPSREWEMADTDTAEVRETPDGAVRVAGVSADEVRVALRISRLAAELGVPDEDLHVLMRALEQASARREHRAAEQFSALVEALSTAPAGLTRSAIAQAQRVARTHAKLLATPTATFDSIAQLRGSSEAAARQWVTRQRKAGRLFTVTHKRRTLMPAFLLTDDGNTFAEMAQVIGPLRRVGMDGWALWVWFDSPSSWLSGERPAELVAQRRFDELARAATRDASNAAA